MSTAELFDVSAPTLRENVKTGLLRLVTPTPTSSECTVDQRVEPGDADTKIVKSICRALSRPKQSRAVTNTNKRWRNVVFCFDLQRILKYIYKKITKYPNCECDKLKGRYSS